MVIRFFASIRNITGVKEIDWGGPPATLGELLRLLSDRYGSEFRRWVLDGESLGSSVMVVVNDNDARHQAGLETPLVATDIVSILPIMAGGARLLVLASTPARLACPNRLASVLKRHGILRACVQILLDRSPTLP